MNRSGHGGSRSHPSKNQPSRLYRRIKRKVSTLNQGRKLYSYAVIRNLRLIKNDLYRESRNLVLRGCITSKWSAAGGCTVAGAVFFDKLRPQRAERIQLPEKSDSRQVNDTLAINPHFTHNFQWDCGAACWIPTGKLTHITMITRN
jgi:hypothetical protein